MFFFTKNILRTLVNLSTMKGIIKTGLVVLLTGTMAFSSYGQTKKDLRHQKKELIEKYGEIPSNPDTLKKLANTYFLLDEQQNAVEAYSAYLKKNPQDMDARLKLAQTYIYEEKGALAEKELTTIILSKQYSGKELAKLYLLRAEAREMQSSSPQDEYAGKQSYDLIRASKIDSLNPKTFLDLGIYYDDNGYFESALEALAKAAEIEQKLAKQEGRDIDMQYFRQFNKTKNNYKLFGRVSDANKFKIVQK